MSSALTDHEVSSALLRSVQHGTYPDTEGVASAELSPTLLPVLQAELKRSRNDVEDRVRAISKSSASDVDEWIAQAKKVQADIERSKITAREIVQKAEAQETVKQQTRELANKASLLEKEVSFNESLTAIFGRIRSCCDELDRAKGEAVKGQIESGLSGLQAAKRIREGLQGIRNTQTYVLLQNKIDNVQSGLVDVTTGYANRLLLVNETNRTISINNSISDAPDVTLDKVALVLSSLDVFDSWVEKFSRSIDRAIMEPLLKSGNSCGLKGADWTVELHPLSRGAQIEGPSVDLEQVSKLVQALSTRLPQSISLSLSKSLMPSFLDRLESLHLNPCVPTTPDRMPEFEVLLQRVGELGNQLSEWGWEGKQQLQDWVQGAARIWFSRQRENALHAVRDLLASGLTQRKVVERVETQMVSADELCIGGEQQEEAWDEEWTDDADKGSPEKTAAAPVQLGSEEDDDASAWDVDEGEDDAKSEPVPPTQAEEDDGTEGEAWGWNDDDQEPTADPTPITPHKVAKVNGHSPTKTPGSRAVTLRENYTVTAVPDQLMQILAQFFADAETLSSPSYQQTPIATAVTYLYNLPALTVAMYRAVAATSYGKIESGSILVYNDCTRLADQMRSFTNDSFKKQKLEPGIKALEAFAKRAYSSEMESQRTILRDLLDGAQGFVNCTTMPFAGECDNAIAMTVDRLRQVYREWQSILSRSALLQSLGSLLGTVTSKMMLDIMDLSDIGEEESKRLRSYCDSISSLHDLFVQEHPSGEGSGDMTGIYCPNWFKFQYLAEILESNLADIKYLWTEGELSLEYESNEIVDLVEALFADSEYRRRAITDIRRSARR